MLLLKNLKKEVLRKWIVNFVLLVLLYLLIDNQNECTFHLN